MSVLLRFAPESVTLQTPEQISLLHCRHSHLTADHFSAAQLVEQEV